MTRLGDRLVRPHDLELLDHPETDTVEAKVVRVVRLGFEIRVEITIDASDAWVQITRDTTYRLNLEPGSSVFVRAIAGPPAPRASTSHSEAMAPVEPSLLT
ncbi:MAG TPA: TOBE-like domain-containing protein [Acidimicrobiales bacterium]